jgi:hypothetical protein
MDFGRFVVKDIHVADSGNVDRFWALYEQHCESPGAPALFGEVRVGEPPASAPETVEPAAISWPATALGAAGTHVPVFVIAGSRGAHVKSVTVAGADKGDFVVEADGCSGKTLAAGARCRVDIAPQPTATGDRRANLLISDAGGAVSTVPIDAPGVTPAPGSPPGSGSPSTPQLPITPLHPRPGRPDLYARLGVVREILVALPTHTIVGYRYFFEAGNIRCINGATNVVFTVGRRRRLMRCRPGPVLISGRVTPHRRYLIKVQAVTIRGGRIVKRGPMYSGRLYMPGSEGRWSPISQLPPSA